MSIPPPPAGPHPPYPSYAQAPQQYPGWPQRPPVNGIAIAAFVLGLLCFVPAAGLVLGLVALARIRKKGERGKGFAVAGSVLSSVGLALWLLMFTTGAAADFWQGFKDGVRGEGTAFALQVGQCFDEPGGSLEGVTYDVDEVPCEKPHQGEVFAAFDLDDGRFPGYDAIARTAEERCPELQSDYAMDSWAVPEHVAVYHFTPTKDSWAFGDREVTCVFGHTDEGSRLTGSLRRDAHTLDPHQIAYLEAARVLNTAMESEPMTEYVEDDLPGHRAWADRMTDALTEQSGMLRAHTWPAAAERPVADLADGLDKARKEWAKAAEATDADTFYTHYDQGYELLDPTTTVTTRKALGLATEPPSYPVAGDGGGDGSGLDV
ncbi:DUF4190 domain-containing protein [Streptomyces poriticola]|uniref:DUF4190 domain-containing protein n=1 Tax=Streptomyces poriticola TaxID=3120506 RepID=UPI002FCDEE18